MKNEEEKNDENEMKKDEHRNQSIYSTIPTQRPTCPCPLVPQSCFLFLVLSCFILHSPSQRQRSSQPTTTSTARPPTMSLIYTSPTSRHNVSIVIIVCVVILFFAVHEDASFLTRCQLCPTT